MRKTLSIILNNYTPLIIKYNVFISAAYVLLIKLKIETNIKNLTCY